MYRQVAVYYDTVYTTYNYSTYQYLEVQRLLQEHWGDSSTVALDWPFKQNEYGTLCSLFAS